MISLSLLLVYTILGVDRMVRNTVRGDTNRGGGGGIYFVLLMWAEMLTYEKD